MIQQFVVDAFADGAFRGNPAAVCILDEWADPRVRLTGHAVTFSTGHLLATPHR